MGVIQWNSLVALNYAAKSAGVKRGMKHFEALEVCPKMMFVHVATMIENLDSKSKSIEEQKQMKQDCIDQKNSLQNKSLTSVDDITDLVDIALDESSIEKIIPSSILKVQVLSHDNSVPAFKRFQIEQRDKESQKVSLAKYRAESKKIFEMIRRYSPLVEKASCDEAYVDITNAVNLKFKYQKEQIFPKEYTPESWRNCYFMGCPKNEGLFTPETEYDLKLFIANDIAWQIRQTIDKELKYKASCGISHNKTMAKLGSSQNKPNAQTVVPIRYLKQAMKDMKISNVRMCGGKVSDILESNGITQMGQIQEMNKQDLEQFLSPSTTQWIKDLSNGICFEEVKERNIPTTANAVKTFKKCYTFQQLEKFIGLVVLDLSLKVKEILEDVEIFPQSFQIGFYDRQDNNKPKTRRFKMISLHEFESDKRALVNFATTQFLLFEKNILPATSISVGIMNFKNINELKNEKALSLNKFFQPVKNEDDYKKNQEKINQKLNQEISKSIEKNDLQYSADLQKKRTFQEEPRDLSNSMKSKKAKFLKNDFEKGDN
ncbi:dna polymerase eta [Stylonychia lemnae]|uniref:Dna polymerase eta n=1 Tax=Stylonychia lemnae TaxID=5949 RepID=A0A078ADJ8_STYLE|nr:dna polymerase eta [Stylonychia lemnae]|eukprot:CDW79896.1 dna polymerase eta [Stylonychia lemnae]